MTDLPNRLARAEEIYRFRELTRDEQVTAAEAMRGRAASLLAQGHRLAASAAGKLAVEFYWILTEDRSVWFKRFYAVALLSLGQIYIRTGRRWQGVRYTRRARKAFWEVASQDDHRFIDEVVLARRLLRRRRFRMWFPISLGVAQLVASSVYKWWSLPVALVLLGVSVIASQI